MIVILNHEKRKEVFIIPNEYYVIVLGYLKENKLNYSVKSKLTQTTKGNAK